MVSAAAASLAEERPAADRATPFAAASVGGGHRACSALAVARVARHRPSLLVAAAVAFRKQCACVACHPMGFPTAEDHGLRLDVNSR